MLISLKKLSFSLNFSTAGGKLDEVLAFNDWIGRLPHKHKLVIAGNHELYFDPSFREIMSPNTIGRTKHNSGLINKIPFLDPKVSKVVMGHAEKLLDKVSEFC